MTKEIKLSAGKITLVDDEDYDFLIQWGWGFDGRYAYRKQYLHTIAGKQKYKKIYLHKLINKTPEGFDTDHINQDKLDNRKVNLRSATRSQNELNKPKMVGTSSKYKGVCWHKQRSKWKAEIKRDGMKKHLGVFDCEQEAAQAFLAAAMEHQLLTGESNGFK